MLHISWKSGMKSFLPCSDIYPHIQDIQMVTPTLVLKMDMPFFYADIFRFIVLHLISYITELLPWSANLNVHFSILDLYVHTEHNNYYSVSESCTSEGNKVRAWSTKKGRTLLVFIILPFLYLRRHSPKNTLLTHQGKKN